MLERSYPATLVLGIAVALLIPVCCAATLSSDITWYHGICLFYAALGLTEIVYLTLLIVLQVGLNPSALKAAS